MVAPAPVVAGPVAQASARRRRPPLPGKLPLMIERESLGRRIVVGVVVTAILIGIWLFTQQFFVAAHPGMDQNGYLVGGKNFANHFSTSMTADDPYAFVGRMWVAANDGHYFPKYPPGFSIVVGVVKLFGGATAAYYINPICMILALAGVFMIVRQVAGSFAGILGMLIVASSPVTLALTNNPNSHATALCLVTWGMYLLLRWWERGTFWRAVLAGALLGLAAIDRYTEALLFLPLLLSAFFNLHWRRGESWGQLGTLIGCWSAPISLVLLSNHMSSGYWTGYDLTNESSGGFKWENFQSHWEVMIRQFAGTGLFFTLPIGLMGLILLLARNWKLSVVLWAWLLPSILIYTGYYWYYPADQQGIGSMRFLLTIFPPVAAGAAWCMTRLVPVAPYSSWALRWIVAPLAALVIVLGAAAMNVWGALPMLENDQRKCQAIAQAADQIINQAKVPSGSVVFGPQEMLNHLQFVAEYRLYDTTQFEPHYVLSLKNIDADEPNGLQPQRAKKLYELLRAGRKEEEFKKQLPADLVKLMRNLATAALSEGRQVFVIASRDGGIPLSFTDSGFEKADHLALSTRKVVNWTEPSIIPAFGRGQASSTGSTQTSAASWQLLEITVGK